MAIFPDSFRPGRALCDMTAPLSRLAARLGPPNPDGELLARFVRDRDPSAFAALVGRHGPTVLGVCRRVLGNTADADDAFQAVFLVLVNRADALAHRSTLGDWLYAAAVRVSLKARTAFARRRKHERLAAELRPESVAPPPSESWLDRELAALPDKLRGPVVLCLIHDRPRSEVAAELGIPEGTLASRLDAARKRLADRLARHRVPLALTGLGVAVPAA
ncbi:MAG: sigma-70 family RNA polymerase sigma factor, partial [Fimbriiglobus sp.]|nr:sigma-70 family RNA polymerase sigma factor [Fimbriiglobus sp.]